MISEQEETDLGRLRSGGQYSLVRAALGLALFVKFAQAWSATARVSELTSPSMWVISAGVLLTCLVAVGWRDRNSGTALIGAWLYMSILEDWQLSALDGVLLMLLVFHVVTSYRRPPPYGAWSMRGRLDPAGAWHLPPGLVDQAWLYLGFGLLVGALGGYPSATPDSVWITWLAGALGALALLSAIWPRSLRPVAWLCLWFTLMALTYTIMRYAEGASSQVLGSWVLLLFLFEPAWIKPRRAAQQELVFYDGECGLCHICTRFLLSEDARGRAFGMAPLQGTTFESKVSAAQRAGLPDSIVVRRADGSLLTKSSGIAHLLKALGGWWRVLGTLLTLIPRPLRDLGYVSIARIRKRIFKQPKSLCPLLPARLAGRFLP